MNHECGRPDYYTVRMITSLYTHIVGSHVLVPVLVLLVRSTKKCHVGLS